MANRRIIYSSQALFVSNSPATGAMTTISQLNRVQTIGHSFDIGRTDVQQQGSLASIDRIILTPPTVNLEFSYNVHNVLNESNLGFNVSGTVSAISYLLDGSQDSKNYFVRVVPDGNDAIGYSATDGGVVGIGNGFISAYTTQGAVGGLPTATVRVEASNIKYDVSSASIGSPAVNPVDGSPISQTVTVPTATSGVGFSALQPGQMRVTLGSAGLGINNKCIQSYSLGVELRREPFQCLGEKFPSARLITFPITATMDIEANVQDLTTGNLASILCNDVAYDLAIALYAPSCTGVGSLAVRYQLKGAKLDSQNETSSIGPAKRVTMRFSAQVGGPQDATRGLFIDGTLT